MAYADEKESLVNENVNIAERVLFPATGFIYLIWKHYHSSYEELGPVVLKNVRFSEMARVTEDTFVNFQIEMNERNGSFSVLENRHLIVTGTICAFNEEDWLGESIPAYYNSDEWACCDQNDINREFHLRGYDCSNGGTNMKYTKYHGAIGYTEWKNYITLLDTMLQLPLLRKDIRNFVEPSKIARIAIDPKRRALWVPCNECDEIPIYYNEIVNVVRCPFMEITNLTFRQIQTQDKFCEPTLKMYKFVPNETDVNLGDSIEIIVQIALENHWRSTLKIVELAKKSNEKYKYLAPLFHKALKGVPRVTSHIVVLTTDQVSFKNDIIVEDGLLKNHRNNFLVAVNKGFRNQKLLEEAFSSLVEDGFVISRENHNSSIPQNENINILSIHHTPEETLYLIRRTKMIELPLIVEMGRELDFNWVESLQEAVDSSSDNVVVCSRNEEESGILGLVNCLRNEVGPKVTAFYVENDELDMDSEEFSAQFVKNMRINVLKSGKWGTYRYLSLPGIEKVKKEHVKVDLNVGDLSSLNWIHGSMDRNSPCQHNEELVEVYYAALNVKDCVMITSGEIVLEDGERKNQKAIVGFEFSGRNMRGERVFGYSEETTLSTLNKVPMSTCWKIPENWTMANAATVAGDYSTALFALFNEVKLSKHQSILIHGDSDGLGISAINIATHIGCKIFTTVNSEEKRNFIKRSYPNIRDTRIGESTDTSFEQMIMRETKGEGVDVVLNSLSDEKLLASIRCLAKNGKFLQIGQMDLLMDSPLPMAPFVNGISFQGISFEKCMRNSTLKILNGLMTESMKKGIIKPLPSVEFDMSQTEDALRFMRSGEGLGKVLVKIREEMLETPPGSSMFECSPRYYCDPEKSVIIIGDLGGFGLELADWLVLRNARNLVLSSHQGIKSGYQEMRIELWRRSYGVNVIICMEDISTETGCRELIEQAGGLGHVESIFNLGAVLHDGIFQKQNMSSFKAAFGPKATATKILDKLSRKMCPELRDFVVFSSVSCGWGNTGQTNYVMANSVMERICERRKREGYPALAIQWGAVGDVGLLAEMKEASAEVDMGGLLPQGIRDCLSSLDNFLNRRETIVASMIIAEKSN